MSREVVMQLSSNSNDKEIYSRQSAEQMHTTAFDSNTHWKTTNVSNPDDVLEIDKCYNDTSNSKLCKEEFSYTTDLLSGELFFENPSDFQQFVERKVLEWSLLPTVQREKTDKPCYFLYRSNVYNFSAFTKVHPGGAEMMYAYNGKDISETFHDQYNAHAHSRYALNMLLQERIGSIKKCADATQICDDSIYYRLEEQTAYPSLKNKLIVYNDFVIDRTKGLIWQAIYLSLAQYIHLISTPIYLPECKLFDCTFLEPFSKTKYWVIPLLWFPLSMFWAVRGIFRDNAQLHEEWSSCWDAYLYYPNNNWVFTNYPSVVRTEMLRATQNNMTSSEVAEAQLMYAQTMSKFNIVYPTSFFLFGVLLWTLMEYVLHRFVFHFEKLFPAYAMDTPFSKLLHMVLHGIHHIIPMDPDRLVFPPVLFVIMAIILYNFYGLFFTGSCLDIIASGITFGYVCYDMIHYHIHHVNPNDFYFKDLKKYHHAHHYVDDNAGYGISNKLWDIVFGTACKIK